MHSRAPAQRGQVRQRLGHCVRRRECGGFAPRYGRGPLRRPLRGARRAPEIAKGIDAGPRISRAPRPAGYRPHPHSGSHWQGDSLRGNALLGLSRSPLVRRGQGAVHAPGAAAALPRAWISGRHGAAWPAAVAILREAARREPPEARPPPTRAPARPHAVLGRGAW